MNKIKNILITGSSGTIGTRLFEKLLEKGYRVKGFDRKENKWNPALNKLTIIGDLLKKDLKKVQGGTDLIIHLAANPRVHELVKKPDQALENVLSLFNTISFARENKVKNIIFSSSREIYGNKDQIISAETDADFTFCESPYSASKISGEAFIISFLKCYGIKYIICRLSNVYGMYDESERFFPLLFKKMKKNQSVNIYGKDKILDFTYIDDCVDGIIKCVVNFEKNKNNVFNISSGSGQKLTHVAQLLKKEMGSNSRIIIKKSLTGEVKKFIADISKAEKLLAYEPQWKIDDGIKSLVGWCNKNL